MTRREVHRFVVHPLVAGSIATALVIGGAAVAAPLIGTAQATLGGAVIGVTAAGSGAYLAAAHRARRRRPRD
ncbi:hypothetical protein [Curtobacterium sp. MCBD17_032]|uniref:hypothetical protein n=1 Tax=Curtobacterium sp. MCBD17_032 TaxID=2175659 RepID=UPI000DA96020|nr:hypothetical protein [Curtobacterium sp. MCBD17_032]PZE87104.1 hypothetical protein DEI91_02085 [Curtobacterium sp. MCBD17_032]